MPENQNIEWKSKWRDDYLEWICGFANAQGGTIYIGIDDNGHVIGLTNTKRLLYRRSGGCRAGGQLVCHQDRF